MSFVDIISLLVVLVNTLLGLFVLLRNYKKRLNQAFFLFALSVSFWVFASWQAGVVREGLGPPLIWEKLSFTAGALIAPVFIYFAYIFTEKRRSFIFRIIILFIIPIFFAIATLTPYVVSKVERVQLGYEATYGFLWYFYTIYFISYLLACFIIIISKYKNSIGILKSRIKYLLIGLLVAALIAVIFNLIIPFFISLNILRNNNFYQFFFHFGHLATIFFIGFTAYAIVRYRLMDIKVVIRKGLVYASSLIIILALYTYLALFLKSTIEKYWNIAPGWTAFILLALVALGFPPLKNLVERSINTLFKGKKSIDLAVKEVREKMAVKTDTDSLIDLIAQEIRKYLELKEVKLFLIDHQKQKFIYNSEESRQEIELDSELVRYFDKYPEILVREEIQHLAEVRNGRFDKEILQKVEKQMKKEKAGLIIPFKTEEEVFCLILIGDRQDNQAYTVQDIEFLEKLREQVSFTLANALLYKEALARIQAEAITKNY